MDIERRFRLRKGKKKALSCERAHSDRAPTVRFHIPVVAPSLKDVLVRENPYTDLVTMVVVDSGEENTGQWRAYRRNILEDYRSLYGEDPPPVEVIAIMTDSDDTGESAVSWFGDIRFISN